MKNTFKFAAAAVVPFAMMATPALAGDSESYVLNLEGSVASNCELTPEGSATAAVDMLELGNQGFLVVGFSCNSPYELTLSSANGGMSHAESGGAVVIDYDVEIYLRRFPHDQFSCHAGIPCPDRHGNELGEYRGQWRRAVGQSGPEL